MKSFLATLGILSLSLTTAIPTITNMTSNINNHQLQENQSINVNISAYDENNNKIMSFHYETILATLGQLMAENSDNYLLKDYGEPLGLYLYGIKYHDNQGKEQTKLEEPDSTFWAFWYVNENGEEEFSSIGISNYYLTQKTENIIWRYTNIE